MRNTSKETGSYYTPQWLSDYIVEYLKGNDYINKNHSILEPSCGDGVFLKSLKRCDYENNKVSICDINKDALTLAGEILQRTPKKHYGDFLFTQFEKKFDLIIGNPPYIHRKYLSNKQKEESNEWLKQVGVTNKRVQNIWPTFIYKGESHLNKNGVMTFVLPEELLKVNYADDTLKFLLKNFDRVEIFSLNKVLFGDAGQNTVVLIAYKKHKTKGLYLGRIEIKGKIRENYSFKKSHLSPFDVSKMPQKYLGSEFKATNLKFLKSIEDSLQTIDDITDSQVGIVTGANDFFILSELDMETRGLQKYCIPIIRKSGYIKNELDISKKVLKGIIQSDKTSYLLKVPFERDKIKDKKLLEYLDYGESLGINRRYKCGTYKPWFKIPNIWPSELIFFKRSSIWPKLVLNTSGADVTDSGYRITMHQKGLEKFFQFCFYNSFTLLMMEVQGRTYGGGVLEVTPNEFKKLPIPFSTDIPDTHLKNFLKKDLSQLEEILEENDKVLLSGILNLSDDQIIKIKKLRKKLISKRLKKDYI